MAISEEGNSFQRLFLRFFCYLPTPSVQFLMNFMAFFFGKRFFSDFVRKKKVKTFGLIIYLLILKGNKIKFYS